MTGDCEALIIATLTGESMMGKRAPHPTRSDVARRAYQLYEARGREDGLDIEDWLRAERELGL